MKRFSTTKFVLFTFLISLASLNSLVAGTSFDPVYEVLQAKCLDGFLEDGSTGNIDFSGTKEEVHAKLVGVSPDNLAAQDQGLLWVTPGRPYKSLLLAKLDNGLIDGRDLKLTPEMGSIIDLTEPLTNIELEMIRQWIYQGAKINSPNTFEDKVLEYYTGNGLTRIQRPLPPPPGHGFQIHLGPLFIEPNDEVEYTLKYDVQFEEEVEVNRINVVMNEQSHHFILYEYPNISAANNSAPGLVSVDGLFNNPFDNEMLAAWQFSEDIRLPGGTAFKWDENTYLDLNYHILNYSSAGILPSEVYINIYTQPTGTAAQKMESELLFYNDIFGFVIPADNEEHTFTSNINNGQQWNLWMLSPHTHQLGLDYDVFVRQPNGSKGEQILEGYYNYQGDFNTGYYDWAHPPIRYFEPYFELAPGVGMIQEAKYKNPGTNPVYFGLTTNDEMMILISQFTLGEALPIVTMENLPNYFCVDESAVEIQTAPSDGVLSGNGIVGNSFDPSIAGVGTHHITYTFEEAVYSQYVVVTEPLASPPIFQGETGLLSTVDDYDVYQWYMNGEPIAGAVFDNYYPLNSGTFTVEVSSGACSTSSDPLQLAVGINEESLWNNNLSVYPNPISEKSVISLDVDSSGEVLFSLLSSTGKLLKTWTEDTQVGKVQSNFNRENLVSGVYYLEVKQKEKSSVKKIVLH